MAVYVDDLVEYDPAQIKPGARQHGKLWCHLTADSDDELHAFALKIGLQRWMFQDAKRQALHHYDLVPGKRARAVKLGAIEVKAGEHFAARLMAEVGG